ncbi:glycosylase [Spirosoma sp. SC4-14]|uniref:glycosylase n=1 Tax=Spirosoma sp. SC4-14 TaxID=3128900 RepID=UPI0030D06C42
MTLNSNFLTGLTVLALLLTGWGAVDLKVTDKPQTPDFPAEMVSFTPYAKNPVFTGAGSNHWDETIRERGYILHEGNTYHLWYTGYRKTGDQTRHLGYATSPDGFSWTRYPGNPIHKQTWVEDMIVVKSGNTYYMFAEGRDDIAHLMTSTDRIHWQEKGPIYIRYATGQPLSKGAYGTPTALKEGDKWYLFYEREDKAIWLATSTDMKVWTNVQDEPVLSAGPEPYDRYAVAVNQVVKYKNHYYAYYHASAFADWREWSTNVAMSDDLIHWKKYSGNPIVGGDQSSGILVNDGNRFRLYTMHPAVNVFLPK